MSETSGKQPLSRRDFIKLGSAAAAAAATAFLPQEVGRALAPVEHNKESNFNFDKLLGTETLNDTEIASMEKGLLASGKLLEFNDATAWQSSVDHCLHTFRDMSQARESLRFSADEVKRTELNLVNQDYHELSSMIWLLLNVNRDFRSGGKDILHKAIASNTLPEALFIKYGQHIDTRWMYSSLASFYKNPDQANIVSDLFTNPKFLDHYASFFFASFLSPGTRANRISMLGKAGGATTSLIEGPISDSEKRQVLEHLEQLRIARVARKLTFVENESPFGGHSDGSIYIGLTNQDLENLFSEQRPWQAFELHEIGHALWNLLPLIPDIDQRLLIRAGVHEALESFFPTKNLDAYLNPQGKFRTLPDRSQSDAILNETAITQYSAGYFLFEAQINGEHLLHIIQQDSVIANARTDADLTAGRPVSVLEQELIREAKLILEKTDASERIPITPSLQGVRNIDNDRRLLNIGIPLALLNMIQTNRSGFLNLVRQSNPRYTGMRLNNLITSYELTHTESLDISGEELFCDLFQSTLRRNDPGITNEMQDDRLEQFQQLITETLDILIEHKLAKRDVFPNIA